MDILKQTGQAAGMIAATAGAYKVGGIAKGKLNSMTAEKLATGGKYKMAPGSMAPGGSGYNPNGKNMPLEKVLERMKSFADKAYKKGWTGRIFARVTRTLGIGVALRLSGFFAGLVAAPFSAGISALISLALAAWTVYDIYLLYDLLFGSGNLEKELEDEDAKASNAKSPTIESDKNKTSIPTPAATPTATPTAKSKGFGETGGGAATGMPNRTPSAMGSQDSSRKQIEAYLGTAISDEQYDIFLKAVGAEAGQDPMERAAVASVILNRAKKIGGSGEDIIKVLNAKGQFQAITGPDGISGNVNSPWSPNARKIIPGIEKQIAQNISLVPKGLDSFTAAERSAYKDLSKGQFERKMAEMSENGGKKIGRTIFSNMGISSNQIAGTKINGGAIASASMSQADLHNAYVSEMSNRDKSYLADIAAGLSSPFQSIQAGLKDVVSVSKATPYERDFYKNLVGTTAL
jgi:hypothetical protein